MYLLWKWKICILIGSRKCFYRISSTCDMLFSSLALSPQTLLCGIQIWKTASLKDMFNNSYLEGSCKCFIVVLWIAPHNIWIITIIITMFWIHDKFFLSISIYIDFSLKLSFLISLKLDCTYIKSINIHYFCQIWLVVHINQRLDILARKNKYN